MAWLGELTDWTRRTTIPSLPPSARHRLLGMRLLQDRVLAVLGPIGPLLPSPHGEDVAVWIGMVGGGHTYSIQYTCKNSKDLHQKIRI